MATEHLGDDEGSSRQRRRGGKRDKSGPRRVWTIREEECLVNGLKSLVTSGWKCENGFRNGYLAQLEAHMTRAFPHSNIKVEPHINSKLHVWKRQYSTLVTMLAKSGLRWDDSRCMVTVEDDSAWDDYVKVDPTAKGMRYKSWPFFPAWREIFGKDRATGERGSDYPATANAVNLEEQAETGDCYVPTAEWNPATGFVGLEEETPSSCNFNADTTINSSSATKRTTNWGKKRKANETSPDIPALVHIVSSFCDTANTRIDNLTRVLETEFGDPDQREQVLEAVRGLPSIEENDALLVARRLVNEPKDMELFFKLSTESQLKMVRLMLDGRC